MNRHPTVRRGLDNTTPSTIRKRRRRLPDSLLVFLIAALHGIHAQPGEETFPPTQAPVLDITRPPRPPSSPGGPSSGVINEDDPFESNPQRPVFTPAPTPVSFNDTSSFPTFIPTIPVPLTKPPASAAAPTQPLTITDPFAPASDGELTRPNSSNNTNTSGLYNFSSSPTYTPTTTATDPLPTAKPTQTPTLLQRTRPPTPTKTPVPSTSWPTQGNDRGSDAPSEESSAKSVTEAPSMGRSTDTTTVIPSMVSALNAPSVPPSMEPTTESPTVHPTSTRPKATPQTPTPEPTASPTGPAPTTKTTTPEPTSAPTGPEPTTKTPTAEPSFEPTSPAPSSYPSAYPTADPTLEPTLEPSSKPTPRPSPRSTPRYTAFASVAPRPTSPDRYYTNSATVMPRPIPSVARSPSQARPTNDPSFSANSTPNAAEHPQRASWLPLLGRGTRRVDERGATGAESHGRAAKVQSQHQKEQLALRRGMV